MLDSEPQSTVLPPSTDELIGVIEAIEVYEKRWIPKGINNTFFAETDYWLFVAVDDTKLCWVCFALSIRGNYKGSEIRAKFPYLTILDEDTIMANVHPNCRCQLRRFKIGELRRLKIGVNQDTET